MTFIKALTYFNIFYLQMTQNCFSNTKYNIKQLVQTATQELSKVSQWLNSNKLTLNVDKTSFMIFKTRGKKVNTPANVTINDKIIKQVKWTKFLGILIDEQMTWKTHINFITNKISKLSGIIDRLRHYIGIKYYGTSTSP